MSFDPGYLNDYGGGNVAWWHDYIRNLINRSNDFWGAEVANLDEEMERLRAENSELRKLRETVTEHAPKGARIFCCASCERWEPRATLQCGYCPIFTKLTTPEHGDQCTAWKEKP